MSIKTIATWQRIVLLCAVVVASLDVTASAHHSRANFDLKHTVQITGKITEFEFRSPHAWITVETPDSKGKTIAYTIEGGSVGSLRRFGWDKDSLKVGESVTVVGNPDRKPENKLIYLNSIQKPDGTVLVVTGEPAVAAEKKDLKVTPSTDFGGVWTRVATEQYFNVDAFKPPTQWPLNDAGKTEVAAFTMRDDPMVNCVSPAMPRITYAPFRHRWTRDGDTLKMEKELSPYGRTIKLGVHTHPDNVEPSRMGNSIGWIDDKGALVIETNNFSADAWGNVRGLDSSTQKTVHERYALTKGGLGMDLELTVFDPAYMTKPYTEHWEFIKGPDFTGDLAKHDCDLESARRHLQFDEDN